MQARYLGDSHDFLKYALLRHLHQETGLRIGLNWYLTRSEEVDTSGNKDGEKRHHLSSMGWQAIDPQLFDAIASYQRPADRDIARFQADTILPGDTLYVGEHVGIRHERKAWHFRAKSALQDADLVFLDPDNGFEIKTMSARTAPKYAFYDEAADYVHAGKVLISIQFARQCSPQQRATETRSRLHSRCDASHLPVMRGRVAPNILFVTVAPARLHAPINAAFHSFALKSQKKVELIA